MDIQALGFEGGRRLGDWDGTLQGRCESMTNGDQLGVGFTVHESES